MVKGIDIFQEYFNEYTDQYVLDWWCSMQCVF